MEYALYDKEYGYYCNTMPKFGNSGDFITASSQTHLFSVTIAAQFKQLFEILKQQQLPCNILEIGAGSGLFARDILQSMPEINEYYILEISAALQQQQQQLLYDLMHKVRWVSDIPNNFIGIVFANEVFDALPTERIVWSDADIYRSYVTYDSQVNKFDYLNIKLDINDSLYKTAKQLPPANLPTTYTSEMNLSYRTLINKIAHQLDTGFIIIIDYGYRESEYYASYRSQGTLRGFSKQRILDDVLQYPGCIDITSSVNFTAILQLALNAGLMFAGYTTQANFLINCGLVSILTNNVASHQLNQHVHMLTNPNQMGDVFKVIGFNKNITTAWMGFSNRSMLL